MTSDVCTHCSISEWHHSTGTYSIVTLIILVSASGWKGCLNVSITEILLRLFAFWLDSTTVWIYSKFTVASCPYISNVNSRRRRVSLLLYSLYVSIGVAWNAVAAAWQLSTLFMKNCVSEWDKTKTVLHSRRREHLKVLRTQSCDSFCWWSCGWWNH